MCYYQSIPKKEGYFMFKKVILFIISAVFTFSAAGCSKNGSDNPSEQKGGYAEEEINIWAEPAEAGELFMVNDKPAFIDRFQRRRYINSDNGFKYSEFSFLKELGINVDIQGMAYSSEGNYFISYYDRTASQNIQYAEILSDGTISKFDFGDEYMNHFEYSSDGRLFAYGMNFTIYEIDLNTKSANPLFDCKPTISAFDVVNNYIIAVDSSEVYFYDIESNKMSETPDAIRNFVKEHGFVNETGSNEYFVYDFCSDKDESIIIICKNGLYRYIMNGNLVEQLIDGIYCNLGNPSLHFNSVLCDTDGSFLVTYNEGAVMRYRYDPELVINNLSSLKIYSLMENDTLLQTINVYKKQNPTVKIDLEVGMRGGITYDDALKNLTTEMLSGNSPDIIMLDGMDIDNYIEKNMLVDLREFESIFNPDNNLLNNVVYWNSKDDLYSVACKFRLPMIVANESDIQNISDLKSLAETAKTKDETILSTFGLCPESIIEAALLYEGDKLITEDGINTENIIEFFDICNTMYKTEYNPIYETNIYFGSSESGILSNLPYLLWNTGTMCICSTIQIGIGTANGFTDDLNIITSLDTADAKREYEYRYGLSEDYHTFVPTCNLGISAASENKKEAAQFMKAALSEELQVMELGDGFPVNKDVLEKFYDKSSKTDEWKEWIMNDEDGSTVSARIEWMTKAEVSKFKNAVNSLDTPIIFDTMTKDIIINAGVQCLEGYYTPEQAAAEISRQLDLRIKE